MFIRARKRGAKTYYEIVESYREHGRVRQRLVGYIGEFDSLDGALAGLAGRAAALRRVAADARVEAERVRVRIPVAWLDGGEVPRPHRHGARAANRLLGEYWASRQRAERAERAVARLALRLSRLFVVKHSVPTTVSAYSGVAANAGALLSGGIVACGGAARGAATL